ncbi:hypothetical protein AB0L16_26310 [Streptomyces orinoci]|uniref:Uncharacterized protein n=1 Tax=Streptomyces orinoci TaxID=67339 RepID=A0ABV3K4F2_STRON|nr:hypothetical protein [Streptomyces orinoci]
MDTVRDVIGQVMDYDPTTKTLQLRPPRGGLEWDARPGDVRPATDRERLNAKVQAANCARRWGG